MRIAALIVGLFGGLAGCIGSGLALMVSVWLVAAEAENPVEAGEVAILGPGVLAMVVLGLADKILILGPVAVAISLLGLVGAMLSTTKPRLAALLMLISALAGLIVIFIAYIMAAIPLGIAALLAFLGRERHAPASQPSHPQV
jgi:hypothetical protein